MPFQKRERKAVKKAEKAFNPFEVRVNRKKHDVLCQKRKSDVGLPGISRSKSIQKRKKTLLLEYKQKGKSNQLVDRRFGEGNPAMSVEERQMKRFIMERKKRQDRSGIFNLKDDNDDDTLTHFGHSIGDMEVFQSVALSDEMEEEENEEDINETHFGGFMKKRPRASTGADDEGDEGGRPKTRNEILDEIVAKSKTMKHERRSEKMEVENLLESVDSDWKSIQGLLSKAGNEGEKIPRAVDNYDKSVRELQFERRGQALDRMKTEEELAAEEKERLEKLEADRIRRMKRLDLEIETDHVPADFIRKSASKTKDTRVTLKYKDGKLVLPEGQASICEKEVDSDNDGDGDSSEAEETSDEESGVEGDQEDQDRSSEFEYGSDLNSEEEDGEEAVKNTLLEKESSLYEKSDLKRTTALELPYTFTVPKSVEELCSLFNGRSPEECLTVAERIHACNHPSLSSSNQSLLGDYLPILLDYCIFLGRSPNQRNMDIVDKLASPLFKLVKSDADRASSVFRQVLSDEYKAWLKRKQEVPSFSTLLLFQLVGVVFPVSDFQHPVTTPTMEFMGQILAKSRVKLKEHLFRLLLLCHIMIKYVTDSKRLVPELVNCLSTVLCCFSSSTECVALPPYTGKPQHLRSLVASMSDTVAMETSTEEAALFRILTGRHDYHCSNCGTVSSDILSVVLDMILQLFHVYKDLPSFPELFGFLQSNLSRVSSETHYSLVLREKLDTIASRYVEISSIPRNVLMMLKEKPKSINFYEPKFDDTYVVDRKKARGRSIGEQQKLKYKLKKEEKGAIREIRKDTTFLAKVKLDETMKLDAERKRKTRLLLSDLQEQQHQAKLEKRTKKK